MSSGKPRPRKHSPPKKVNSTSYRFEQAGESYDPVMKMRSKADQLKEDIALMEEPEHEEETPPVQKGRTRSPVSGRRPQSALKGSGARSPTDKSGRRARLQVNSGHSPATPKAARQKPGVYEHPVDALGKSPLTQPGGMLVEALRSEMADKQESYLRREDAYKTEIQELKDAYDVLAGSKKPPFDEVKNGQRIKAMHQGLLDGLDVLGEPKKKDDSHHSLVASLKERLYAAEAQARSVKKENSAEEWMQRAAQIRGEMLSLQEHTQRLDRLYKNAQADKERLQQQYRCQEDDREFLVRQLVAVKKENARLRTELMRVREDLVAEEIRRPPSSGEQRKVSPSDQSNVEDGAGGERRAAAAGTPEDPASGAAVTITDMVRAGEGGEARASRYEEVIQKQRKMLDRERMLTRKARADHMEAVQSRTELQMLLRECVDDVRRKRAEVMSSMPPDGRLTPKGTRSVDVPPSPSVARRRPASALPSARGARVDAAEAKLVAEERENLLEALFAKERVLTILFDKTFTGLVPAGAVQAAQEGLEKTARPRTQGLGVGQGPAGLRRPSFSRNVGSSEALLPAAAGRTEPSPWALNVDHMLAEFMGAK